MSGSTSAPTTVPAAIVSGSPMPEQPRRPDTPGAGREVDARRVGEQHDHERRLREHADGVLVHASREPPESLRTEDETGADEHDRGGERACPGGGATRGVDEEASRIFANVGEQPGIAKALKAEREGFEPPGLVGLPLSRRVHLSALPPFRPEATDGPRARSRSGATATLRGFPGEVPERPNGAPC